MGLIYIRPTADQGVIINGIPLWSDGPKDERGYVFGRNNRNVTVCYNFQTGRAEVYLPPEKRFVFSKILFLGTIVGIISYALLSIK